MSYQYGKIYVPGKGSFGAKIMFVGEAPSFDEEHSLEPFTGPSGQEFDKLLRDAGLSRGDAWISNLSKYSVPPNPKFGKKIPFQVRAKQAGINLEKEISNLREEIHVINPNIVVLLGGSALWGVTGKEGIQDYRGSLLLGMGKKCISTYHPAHLLYMEGEVKGYWNRQVMIFDLKRAKEEMHSPELVLPSRVLSVARSSYDFEQFLKRHIGYVQPAIDIEAHPNGSGIPICVGIAFTPDEGITIPLWNCDGISNIPDSDMVHLLIMLARFLAAQEVIGQNFKYDQDKLYRLGFIIKRLYSDTMLKAFAINPELPKTLAFNTSIYTREPFYKNEGMYEGSIGDLLLGCARDACCTKEVDIKMDADLDALGMRPFYQNFLMELHDIYLASEDIGFAVDESAREALLRKYIRWDEELRYELWKLAGHPINTNSWQQVGKFIYEEMKCPKREGTGEEVLTGLLNVVKKEEQAKAIDLVLTDRRVRKTISTYLMALPDYDGRMKTTYFLCLETGRTATGQLEAPIRPTIKYKEDGKWKNKSIGTAFQTMTKHGDIGQDVRSMYIPG